MLIHLSITDNLGVKKELSVASTPDECEKWLKELADTFMRHLEDGEFLDCKNPISPPQIPMFVA